MWIIIKNLKTKKNLCYQWNVTTLSLCFIGCPPTENFVASTVVDLLLKATVRNVLYITKWSVCSEVQNQMWCTVLRRCCKHYSYENIWQMAGQNIFILKNHYCLLTSAWNIAGMAHFKLHLCKHLKSFVWLFCIIRLQNVRDIWMEYIFLMTTWKSK